MSKTHLSWQEAGILGKTVAKRISAEFVEARLLMVYPVPRGGIPAAHIVVNEMLKRPLPIQMQLTSDPKLADLIMDDIVDSGKTKAVHAKYEVPFYSLVDKTGDTVDILGWVVFPWEDMVSETGPQDAVVRLLEYIGEDVAREGLRDTPLRVIRSYATLFGGYQKKPEDVLTFFEDDSCDEMVVLKDIEFCSTCEHHMLPFFGKAHIAYVPNGKVVGISKLARVLEIFSRRLQIQERLCQQVTESVMTHLDPKGAACVLEAKHLCMVCRGVEKQHSVMVTSSLTGVFRETDNLARMELMNIIGR